MFICMQKTNSIPNFFFWDIVKALQTCYLEYFEMLDHGHEEWQYHLVGNFEAESAEINCRKLWYLFVWKKTSSTFFFEVL